jgi:hypothetical protein
MVASAGLGKIPPYLIENVKDVVYTAGQLEMLV